MTQQHNQAEAAAKQAAEDWEGLPENGTYLNAEDMAYAGYQIGFLDGTKWRPEVSEDVKGQAWSAAELAADGQAELLAEYEGFQYSHVAGAGYNAYLAGASGSAAALALAKSQCEELMKENMALEGKLEKVEGEAENLKHLLRHLYSTAAEGLATSIAQKLRAVENLLNRKEYLFRKETGRG